MKKKTKHNNESNLEKVQRIKFQFYFLQINSFLRLFMSQTYFRKYAIIFKQ